MDKMQESIRQSQDKYAEKIAKRISKFSVETFEILAGNVPDVPTTDEDVANSIINEDLKEVFEHAQAYEKLLEQTRGKCPNCEGRGYSDKSLFEKECMICHGTGLGEPDPKRIVILAEDQEYPPYSENLIDIGIRVEKARDKTLSKAGFKKVLHNKGEKCN